MKLLEESGPEAYNIKVREGQPKDDGGFENAIPGYKALYRETDGQCLGIHSESYGVVQYPDIKQITDNAIEFMLAEAGMSDGPRPEFTSYILPSGKTKIMGGKCRMTWRMPMFQEKEITTGDALAWVFDVSTSHDGVWSIQPNTGIERVACLNGWVAQDNVLSTRFKHTKNVNIEMIVKRLNESLSAFRSAILEYGELFSPTLGNCSVSHAEGLNIITNLFGRGDGDDREEIAALWERPFLWRNIPSERIPAQSGWYTGYRSTDPEILKHNGEEEEWRRPRREEHTSLAALGDLFNCVTQHLTHGQGSKLYAAQRSQRAFAALVEHAGRGPGSEDSLKLICSPPKRSRNRDTTPKEVNKLEIVVDNTADLFGGVEE